MKGEFSGVMNEQLNIKSQVHRAVFCLSQHMVQWFTGPQVTKYQLNKTPFCCLSMQDVLWHNLVVPDTLIDLTFNLNTPARPPYTQSFHLFSAPRAIKLRLNEHQS
jgi:hypothetical protein